MITLEYKLEGRKKKIQVNSKGFEEARIRLLRNYPTAAEIVEIDSLEQEILENMK